MFGVTKRAAWRPAAGQTAIEQAGALAARLATVVAFPWLIIASLLAVFGATAATIVGWQVASDLPDPDRAGVALNAIGLGVALLLSIGLGLARPAWWRRGVALAALLPALLLTVTSGQAAAVLAALAVVVPTTWLGRVCAARLLGPIDRLTAWVVGHSFGFGFIAAFGFALGSVGLLRPALIWPTLLALTVALFLAERRRARDDLLRCAVWLRRPAERDHITLLLVGIALALLWYNLIGSLSPEIAIDTVRVRLAATDYFAQTRQISAADPELFGIIQTPAAGEIANAVVAAVGPLHAVKLLTFLQGVACTIAIFAIGRRLHSAQAGLVAAFIYYSMPLVSWLSQTALLDLLTSLLAISTVLIIISRAVPDWRIAVAAGISVGLGVGLKLHFGYVAIGLAVIIGVRSLCKLRPSAALRLVVVMGMAGALTAGPWLARSAFISNTIPGLALATESLTRAEGKQPTIMYDLPRFGFGRSFGHLLRSLFDMTVYSAQFEWPPTRYGPFGGLIGFVLLGLLPLSFIAFPMRRRLVLPLLAGGTVSFLLWFYTAQYLRYGLPVLAMLCPLAGIAYGVTRERGTRDLLHAAMRLALLVLVFSGVAIQMQVPAMGRHFVLGRESKEEYLDRNLTYCVIYPVMRLINTQADITRVFSTVEVAHIYTTVRISSPFDTAGDLDMADDETTLLSGLDEGGYSHIVIDRNRLIRSWELEPLADEAFLRRNTTLVGGQDGVYLYRLLPPGRRGAGGAWTVGDELLPGAVAGRAVEAGSLAVIAPIVPGTAYLLSHRTRGEEGSGPGKATIALTWRDRDGRTLATTSERVPTSPQDFHQFSTLGVAPPGAATVAVTIAAVDGAVQFADLSLRALATGTARR